MSRTFLQKLRAIAHPDRRAALAGRVGRLFGTFKAALRRAAEPGAAPPHRPSLARPLRQTAFSGANPGDLTMFSFAPDNLPENAPLVVILHGCGQSAAELDLAAGWSELAERHGFALLAPQQTTANHLKGCFNWYSPGDVTRGAGEAASIIAMIHAMRAAHGLDPARTFVAGLSAGGSMAGALLAAYPEEFAGGALFAALPYGAASGTIAALAAMARPSQRSAGEWGDLVRAAAPEPARRPSVSIWQGLADRTVNPANAEALAAQWTDAHGLRPGIFEADEVDGHTRRVWRGADGGALVELYEIEGLGHAIPLDADGAGEAAVGTPGLFAAEAGICAPWRIAQGWGLLGPVAERALRQHLPPGLAIRSARRQSDPVEPG